MEIRNQTSSPPPVAESDSAGLACGRREVRLLPLPDPRTLLVMDQAPVRLAGDDAARSRAFARACDLLARVESDREEIACLSEMPLPCRVQSDPEEQGADQAGMQGRLARETAYDAYFRVRRTTGGADDLLQAIGSVLQDVLKTDGLLDPLDPTERQSLAEGFRAVWETCHGA